MIGGTWVSQTEVPTQYFFIKTKITYHIQVQYEKKQTKIKDQRKVEGWDRVSHLESEGSWLELNWCAQADYNVHGGWPLT